MTIGYSQIKTGCKKMVFTDMGKGHVTFFWSHGQNIMHETATTYPKVLWLDRGAQTK